jgi:hypothetical protein
MKHLLVVMFAIVMLSELATPQSAPSAATAPAVCPNYPPERPTTTELDPNPARYKGFGLPGEEPTPWPEEKDYKLTDKGAEITYHDAGQLYTHECPEGSAKSYWFEEDRWVKHLPTEGCWKWEPVKISSCEADPE